MKTLVSKKTRPYEIMMPGKRFFKNVRHKIRLLIDCYPALYLPLCRLRPKTRRVTVGKDTELVIEGYPRSANTFAVAAFLLAQGRPVKLARHLHAPAQVIAAAKKGIPTLVLVRNPRDAVLSQCMRAPHISIEQALKDYVRFYRSVLPYKDKYVIGRFEEVTTNFGSVIQRINERFGTNFKLFEHTEENLKKVFQRVEEMDKKDTGLPYVKEETVARPSPKREKLKRSLQEKLNTPRAKRLLLKAEKVYHSFAEIANKAPVMREIQG